MCFLVPLTFVVGPVAVSAVRLPFPRPLGQATKDTGLVDSLRSLELAIAKRGKDH